MAGAFRSTVWDPTLIVGQIICLQSAFYSAESTLLFLWSLSGYQPSLAHMFAQEALKTMVLAQLLASLCCALLLPVLVGRARQCLDFAVTVHFLHLLAVCLYNRTFPVQFSWWLLQVISCSVCTVLGEWLCQRRERAEIPLSNQPKVSGNRASGTDADTAATADSRQALLEV